MMNDTVGRLSLWGIEVFLAAAEDGSVSVAAKRLGTSPSSVSQQISNLETALGTELLNRRERPMTLTPAGRILRRRAQTILSEASRARSEITGLDLSQLGSLRLGMVEDFEASVTPMLLSDMADTLTRTRFELETGPSHRLLDHLEHRSLDVIVAAEFEPANWMVSHPLLDDPFVAITPKGVGSSLSELKDLSFIEYTRRHAMGRELAAHLSGQGFNLPHRFEIDSYRAMMAMVAGGAGWTILTALGAQHAGRYAGEIDVHPMPFAPKSRRISVSVRKDGMEDMASDIAVRLRPLIDVQIVKPAVSQHPWLEGLLTMLT
ncbi:LysR family transcriptional regulator [Pacificibacter marinus]|uniref:HTH-type transcriptional regulator GltR n=1 Tax=Pacificibacter marinus TaxID=658057 RepID=A0A1Y5SQM6_9RHOB|nr:LysR family transcriptional regulator [Pacificibacter marinus]SEK67678.1 DNA-binding transcriptional regulator, LysR family [Pacificibacter marinus]SLN46190.1 HTH-type transcriptional regulator GltR [Pacificibacter marinus]